VRLDLNVQAAWDQGITGKNVTTAIMDDGKYKSIILFYISVCFISFKPECQLRPFTNIILIIYD
jgi:hypothetical protein